MSVPRPAFRGVSTLPVTPPETPLLRAARAYVEACDKARADWDGADWSDAILKRKELAQALREYDEGQRTAILSSEIVETLCQSPIERAMFKALRFELPAMGAAIGKFGFLLPNIDCDADGVFISPQAQCGPYRVDFLIAIKYGEAREAVVVECDGHDFHERTKEQAAHDKARDRWFQEQAITVLRFTGSEIHKSAAGCAAQVSRLVLDRSIALMAEGV